MRHYEIVFIVHPDQSEQVTGMIDRYRQLVERDGGNIHRCEDWGRRQLAYPIAKIHKAHYVLLNIEVEQHTLAELESGFRFNDAVLRSLTIRRNRAETGNSKIYEEALREQQKKLEREQRQKMELESRRKELEQAHASRSKAETAVKAADAENSEPSKPAAEASSEATTDQEPDSGGGSESAVVEDPAEKAAEESSEEPAGAAEPGQADDSVPEDADDPEKTEKERPAEGSAPDEAATDEPETETD